ncbi:phosphonate metabolism transcriptional regulator PhnF [Deinococcus sonorensis]|uniref:Phosphonate metabolism transcriptional regulator PhnF n=2 Tax=Deinococcus sonorensis TaxID=309891 RepID=A0AAU7UGB5_9DEIO
MRSSLPTVPGADWGAVVDAGSATPIYLQVAAALARSIEQGQVPVGTALPAERELAARLGVSRVTVRQALARLTEQGLLERRQGSGTFVAPARIQHPLSELTSFSTDMAARGAHPGAQVLQFECVPPTALEAMTLALSPGERVYRVRRLRTADQEPLAVEQSTLPQRLVGELAAQDVQDHSLYQLLADRQLSLRRAIRKITAVSADPEQARLLQVPVGAALLATERLSWDGQGRPLEFASAHYRGDRYEFMMELQGGQP